ncbi:pantoate--beta-alanine ligase [Candidatus Hakubella thermalkaliphila]|uniref:Pantothenate synthetase n=1 Tax=Candidatus Hakubella thermalkaliphila TaxID=2754717 RepID=A0A6V8PUB2_9ACTN|nr:pantoate--beta-alanine ligase [Candidatus Hakubella thermalkaliphila]GFP35783.1 pantoate--beta-alanine ligase [Candidatus Hakubella thermalkaliphila]
MKVISTIKELRAELSKERQEGKTIGLIPTMGYFHQGHLELMRRAREECAVVVVSLYVNPTQFAPSEDFESYPRDFERDKRLAENVGVDYLFCPSNAEMYLSDHLTYVEVEKITNKLCGASRPHHFKGVTTVVANLFNIVKPDKAYVGQKDAQQVVVIRKMVKDLNFDLEIVVVPTAREEDGLAMSSRNTYLSAVEREEALVLSKSLQHAKELIDSGERIAQKIKEEMQKLIKSKPHVNLEYISICDNKTLEELSRIEGETLIALAAKAGKARLIDNIVIRV